MPRVVVTFVLFFAASLPAPGQENVVRNPGFEQLATGQPVSWWVDSYRGDTDNDSMGVTDEARSGSHAVRLRARRPDDVKLIQHVPVEPNAVYRLSAWVKVRSVGDDQLGANLSTTEISATSSDVRGTSAGWVPLEVYGRTGEQQRVIPLTLRLGGYGRVNVGEAVFDDISVVRVDQPPTGARVIDLFNTSGPTGATLAGNTEMRWAASSLAWALGGSALFAAVAMSLTGLFRIRGSAIASSSQPIPLSVWTLLLFAAALRVWLAIASPGLPNDIAAFSAWAQHAATHSLFWSYIDPNYFLDYPPGYLYVLFLLGTLSNVLALTPDDAVFVVLLKLPAILAEAVIAWILFRAAQVRWGASAAAGIAVLFLLSPAVLINAAAWGQVDAVLTLAIITALLQFARRHYGRAGALFALALLIKPQALLWLPLGGMVLVIDSWRQHSPRPVVTASVGFALVFSTLVLPFSLVQGPGWIFALYHKSLGSYPYATLNAFNLYALLGWNWASIDNSPLTAKPWLWGILFVVPTLAFIGSLAIRSSRRHLVLYAAALLLAMAFTFVPKMHERYLYAVVPLLLLCFGRACDRRLLMIAIGYSVTVYIGEVTTLLRAWEYDFYGIPNDFLLMRLVAFANVALFAWLVKVGVDLYWRNRPPCNFESPQPADLGTPPTGFLATPAIDAPPRLYRLDVLLLVALLVPYSALAYYQLGSRHAPQTYWQPTTAAVAVADLGETRQLKQIDYFLSLGKGAYTVDFSTDQNDWHSPVILEQKSLFEPINWRTAVINQTVRYIRVQTEIPGAMLNEVVPIDVDGEILSAVPIEDSESLPTDSAAQLFDEPNTRPDRAGFLSGTYFDEVYHARTALEHLLLIPHSETTHPPLGKLLIGAGIALFGANPFGWRFMGVAFGVLMIVAIYAMALQLFRRRLWAFVAAFLLAFDFLHFTQSRIATIDVFPAFFVLLSFLFMFRFHETDWVRASTRSSRWLLLSAACFGAGLACKWNALFAAPGLLLIFVYSAWTKLTQLGSENQAPVFATGLQSPLVIWRRLDQSQKAAMRDAFGTALAAFNLITLGIYFAAYVPLLLAPGTGRDVAEVLRAQAHMFAYHASITDQSAHPFASPWWQWPLLIQPVWYWHGDTGTPGKVSLIVAHGNPAIWWAGIAAALYCIYLALARRDQSALLLIIAFCSLYLPWALSPRKLTFLYHFLPAVPFMVLMITRTIRDLCERLRLPWFALGGYLTVVALLFAIFYPVLSGIPVPVDYKDSFLRWLPTWTY
jgi:Gpi18-like mannosyltransferase/4-amino-4-deoxy-L-arabinose transferase-like glycosyltransferase